MADWMDMRLVERKTVTLDAATVRNKVHASLASIILQHTMFTLCVPLVYRTITHLTRNWRKTQGEVLVVSTIGFLCLLNILNLIGGDINKVKIILDFLRSSQDVQTPSGFSGGYLFAITMQFSIWLADIFMLYRVSIVWKNWKSLVLPFLGFLTTICLGVFQLSQSSDSSDSEVIPSTGWNMFVWPSFATSAMCLVLIFIGRVIFRDQKTRDTSTINWTFLLAESGLLYTLVKIPSFVGLNTFASIPASILISVALATPCSVLLLEPPAAATTPNSDLMNMKQKGKQKFTIAMQSKSGSSETHTNDVVRKLEV